MITEKEFLYITKLIINNIEGGYYNPNYHPDPNMLDSGETMFGIDRRWGGAIPQNQKEYNLFWSKIDAVKNPNTWKRYYRGGNLEKELTELAAKIEYEQFRKNVKTYIEPYVKSNKGYKNVQNAINKYKKVALHFIYATWNGSGRFGQFATMLANYLSKGMKSEDHCFKFCMKCRRSLGVPLIAKGAGYLEEIVKKESKFFKTSNTKKIILISVLSLALIGTGAFLVSKFKK